MNEKKGTGANIETLMGILASEDGVICEGTGIGLKSVVRVILWHGGKRWAEGKANEGATINCTFN
jgi:light-regulated signal transduction histidine kinase (bacteriophytochrome)